MSKTVKQLLGSFVAHQLKDRYNAETMPEVQALSDEQLLKLANFGKMRLHWVRNWQPDPEVVKTAFNEQEAKIEALTKHQAKLEEMHLAAVKARQEVEQKLERAESELKNRREQILDINQWSALMLSSRNIIRPRVLWSMIADINNRTSD